LQNYLKCLCIQWNKGTSKNGGWGHANPLPMNLTWGCQRLVRLGFAIVFQIKNAKKGEWGMCTHILKTMAQTSSELCTPQFWLCNEWWNIIISIKHCTISKVFFTRGINLSQNGDKLFLEKKFHATNGKAQTCTQCVCVFFSSF
jgi:hypothetical protein